MGKANANRMWVGGIAAVLIGAGMTTAWGGEEDAVGLRVRTIGEFGPTATAAETEATYRKALDALTRAGGGILVVPEDVPSGAKLENTARWSHSVDPASCLLRDWKVGPGVLVIDNRRGTFTLRVPQLGDPGQERGGFNLNRTMRLPRGDSLRHWTEEPVLSIQNNVVHGPCNYLEWLEAPVQAGKDARFYVPTVRNLFPGMYLNAHHGPGYRAPVARITVKTIGWDPEKRMHYFTADTNTDHVRGAIVQNKSHTPAIRVENNLNAANQTFDFYMRRNQYANGDAYMFDAGFFYMGNVHSMAGDENGACYVAYIKSLTNIFRGEVAASDPAANTVAFKPNAQNAHTLANSRPIVNLNPEKWITAGQVVVVPPGDPARPYATVDEGKWRYQGETYPTRVVQTEHKGAVLEFGGLIRGDADCPWDESIVGRFFAIDEPTEYVAWQRHFGKDTKEQALRRWYEIAGVTENPDGTKDLLIKRYWWGAKPAGSPTLYDPRNYTRDGRVRPLDYIIAPGAYVNDVSRAVGTPHQRSGKPPRVLGISPHPDAGTDLDFAPGDPIEQAIGADPFKPQGLRVWAFDAVPGAWPASMIELANHGRVARARAVSVGGGPVRLEDCADRPERRPAWDSVFQINSAAGVGLDCHADFAKAAILLRQPNHEQPIVWQYGDRTPGKPIPEASLTVSNRTGRFRFNGNGLEANGPVARVAGLSATGTPARNLRGINVPVAAGAAELRVTFPEPEPDADYAVSVSPSWMTPYCIPTKTEKGFTVRFGTKPGDGAMLDWIIVR